MKNNIKYQKTEYGVLLNTLLLTAIISLIITFYFQTGTSSIPSNIITLCVIVMLVIAWLLIHKLTIKIDDKYITAALGIGLLKRKITVDEIDFNSIETVEPSLLTGIGIRYTPKGWLWNVKFGKAIYFKTKNGKTFFVGTDDAEKIKDILTENK